MFLFGLLIMLILGWNDASHLPRHPHPNFSWPSLTSQSCSVAAALRSCIFISYRISKYALIVDLLVYAFSDHDKNKLRWLKCSRQLISTCVLLLRIFQHYCPARLLRYAFSHVSTRNLLRFPPNGRHYRRYILPCYRASYCCSYP